MDFQLLLLMMLLFLVIMLLISGSNCLGFNANSSVAGPEDVVICLLSNTGVPTPYVSGVFTLTHMIYVC